VKNRVVNIITGDEMNDLSNKTFELEVHPKCDHSYILSEFMNEQKIKYKNCDLAFSHSIVQMAALSNIVIFKGGNFYLISLPNQITEYQLKKLEEYRPFIINERTILCLMDITKENERLVFNDYNSKISPEIYDYLINQKHQTWKSNQEEKTKRKQYPNY